MNKRMSTSIYETDDFDRFTYPTWNRATNHANVAKLAESMMRFGYLGSPIVVNRFNEVVDGQHRLKACEKANVPVKYIVCDGYTSIEAMQLNATQKSWTSMDYYVSYATQGNPNYMRLVNLLDTYKETIKVTFSALGLDQHGLKGNQYRGGELIVTEEMMQEAEMYLNFLSRARSSLVGDFSNVKKVLVKLSRHELIDEDRMIEQLEKYNDSLRVTGIDNIVESLEGVYNRNRKNKEYFTDKVKVLKDRGEW